MSIAVTLLISPRFGRRGAVVATGVSVGGVQAGGEHGDWLNHPKFVIAPHSRALLWGRVLK